MIAKMWRQFIHLLSDILNDDFRFFIPVLCRFIGPLQGFNEVFFHTEPFLVASGKIVLSHSKPLLCRFCVPFYSSYKVNINTSTIIIMIT